MVVYKIQHATRQHCSV